MKSASSLAVSAVLVVLGMTTAGCSAKGAGDHGDTVAQGATTVDASESACKLSETTASTGTSTFEVTNTGNKVTEFYVYGEGERVMGEVENISPGLKRQLVIQLSEPGAYQTSCRPGMVGEGIRGDFTVVGDTVQIDAEGKFKEAADSYKRYVIGQADALIPSTEAFAAAVKAKDVVKAKALYPTTRTFYERIEPVAETFPDDLDPRIDLRESNLEPGQHWTGFHALEKQLWATGLHPDAGPLADQLLADVKELEAGVKASGWTIDSTQIAGGAQGLLDEIARTKISGEEDIFSHTDFWDFKANVEGSQSAVASVRPILDERDAALGQRVDQRFAAVEELLEKYRHGDEFVPYDTVTDPQRQQLSRAIDALSNEVSQAQGTTAHQ
ncbi:peptidase M75 [Mycolicibacterium peregrinum]|uniref:Peptidase M75 n=1 Tax=Mycolicibacterium peregrinum TaxID=43304 RepID=A0A1A0RFP9_MYCPR|nr:iron uptake system protein EfeO [Mycolicibacterium peregrinum]OBB32529.1 peptidase M75 [Mycolicibacterium peregrinum]